MCLLSVINRYESFDFHKECRKMQWHKLSILINRLSAEQGEFKYILYVCLLCMHACMYVCNSCIMYPSDLSDMYTQAQGPLGPRAWVYISGKSRGHMIQLICTM